MMIYSPLPLNITLTKRSLEQKVFALGTRLDVMLQVIGGFAAVGSGAAFPMMAIPFGKLTTAFTGFFTPGSGVTPEEFRSEINKLW